MGKVLSAAVAIVGSIVAADFVMSFSKTVEFDLHLHVGKRASDDSNSNS